MRVLVVDDEPAVRAAVERALALERYDVAVAADGREALDHVAAETVDAVVLDIAMPHVDAIEVCRRMRQAGDRTPVLLFERFHRGPAVCERHGSGLGLAIVRQVVESHGGTVEAANADGGGLVLTLTFPAVATPVLELGVRVA